jgi:hypothetical protein
MTKLGCLSIRLCYVMLDDSKFTSPFFTFFGFGVRVQVKFGLGQVFELNIFLRVTLGVRVPSS